MLPVLFHIAIPGGWAWVAAIAVALAVVGARAVSYLRHARKDGKEVSLGAALWSDKATVGAFLVALFAAWRAGVLDDGIRVPLHTYGVMLALAFVASIWLAQKEAERQG